MIFDILYILGLLITWYGNTKQIFHVIRTKSTKSLSLHWLWALLICFLLRLPLAFTSDFWVWKCGYVVSTLLMIVMLATSIYYRKKYPRK